jgi:hypothetical protein
MVSNRTKRSFSKRTIVFKDSTDCVLYYTLTLNTRFDAVIAAVAAYCADAPMS